MTDVANRSGETFNGVLGKVRRQPCASGDLCIRAGTPSREYLATKTA